MGTRCKSFCVAGKRVTLKFPNLSYMGLYLLCAFDLLIGRENSPHLLPNQSDAKQKSSPTWFPSFSRALGRSPVLIGCCDNLGFNTFLFKYFAPLTDKKLIRFFVSSCHNSPGLTTSTLCSAASLKEWTWCKRLVR